jgi:hypothetical protein
MRVRKRISKRLEHDKDGVQVDASVNAVVAANVGESGSVAKATSRQSVVGREDRRTAESGEREPSDSGAGDADRPVEDEHARELPDREGTYDELREAAAEQEANEGAKDD